MPDECSHRRKKRMMMTPSSQKIASDLISPVLEDEEYDGESDFSDVSEKGTRSIPVSSVQILNDTQASLRALQNVLAEKQSRVSKDQQLRISGYITEVFRSVSQLLLEREVFKADLATANAKLIVAKGEVTIEKAENQHRLQKILQLESDLGPVMRRVADATEASLSFADMVKNGPQKTIPPINRSGLNVGTPKPAVCIFPKLDSIKDSDDTKQLLKNVLRPSDLGIRVTGMRSIRNKGVVIHTATKEDQQKILKTPCLTNSVTLSARLPTKRHPRVIFFNVPRDLTDECFLTNALAGVQDIADLESTVKNCKLSHLAGARTGTACHRVYEVPARVRHVLVEQGKVFVDWNVCRVRDFIGLTVCSKCQMIGHSFKFCKDQQRCGHCAGEGHTRINCPKAAAEPVCATCTRFGKPAAHPTGDKDSCPAYKAALSKDFATIDYGV